MKVQLHRSGLPKVAVTLRASNTHAAFQRPMCARVATACRLGAAVAIGLLALPIHAQRGSQGYVPQFNQGRQALRDRKWSAAAYHFRMALEWDSKGVGARAGLGEVYLKTGRIARALEEFKAVLRLKPHSAEAEQGIHQARTEGEEERAFQALAEQIKNDPENADAHTTYAEELLERNQTEPARREAELALKLDAKQGHAWCVLGRIAAKEARDDEARALLEKAIRLDNTDDDALATLGDLAMRKKDYARAASFYRRVVGVVPDETEGHRKLADALTLAGDARGAAREKQMLARLGSQNR